MKRILLTLMWMLLGALPVCAAEQLVPAGSLLQCTMSEPKFSSKTAAIGDPVLCQLGMTALYGPSVLPYNSYLEGRFADYRDPGHFVGKGWMELDFNRMLIEPNTVIPIQLKVVNASGYNIDREGRIMGRGHAVRDTVEWLIPVLWPIDLLMLPRRGPRPVLKAETQLTLKVMNDFGVPETKPLDQESPGLYRRPTSYDQPPPQAEPREQDNRGMYQRPSSYDEPPMQAEPPEQAVQPMQQPPIMAESAPYPAVSYPAVSYPTVNDQSYRPTYLVAPPPQPPTVYYYRPMPRVYYYAPPPRAYMTPYGPVWYRP
ncbi:MAG TPA: hypothetical protein VGR47_13985 [Terracidiphilus sp.]|nr:hypothetical protein [Terracidiphilus sp.]